MAIKINLLPREARAARTGRAAAPTTCSRRRAQQQLPDQSPDWRLCRDGAAHGRARVPGLGREAHPPDRDHRAQGPERAVEGPAERARPGRAGEGRDPAAHRGDRQGRQEPGRAAGHAQRRAPRGASGRLAGRRRDEAAGGQGQGRGADRGHHERDPGAARGQAERGRGAEPAPAAAGPGRARRGKSRSSPGTP